MALAMEAEEAVSLPVTYARGQVVQVQGEDTSCESLRGHAQVTSLVMFSPKLTSEKSQKLSMSTPSHPSSITFVSAHLFSSSKDVICPLFLRSLQSSCQSTCNFKMNCELLQNRCLCKEHELSGVLATEALVLVQ